MRSLPDTPATVPGARLERDGNADIARTVRMLGGKLIRVHSGHVVVSGGRHMKLAEAGTPDHIALFPDGLTIWLEQKRPGGKLSQAQRDWHAWARRNGHRVAVVETGADVVRAVNEARAK